MLRPTSSRVVPSFCRVVHAHKVLPRSPIQAVSHLFSSLDKLIRNRESSTHLSVASFSTKASAETQQQGIEQKCHFRQTREHCSSPALATDLKENILEQVNPTIPQLKQVPKMPLFGSFFTVLPVVGEYLMNRNGIPIMTKSNAFDFYPEMKSKFGNFYCMGIPGVGEGIYGTIYFLNDPIEMLKVVRQEGSYPRGGVEILKPFIKWGKERGMKMMEGDDNGFFGQGKTWRKYRTFMQTDLLSPQSASGYVPGVVESAEIASRSAGKYRKNLNLFLNYCAFDMFNTIMFGELTKVACMDTPTDPVNERYCEENIKALSTMISLIMDVKEVVKAEVLGIETPMYKEFSNSMGVTMDIAQKKVIAFKERWERNELNEKEKVSYLARCLERRNAKETVSTEAMVEITVLMLNAAVDTTSTFISWALVHLSLNPEVQERLHEELKKNLDSNGGHLSSDMLTKTKSPYLHAVLRESQRITPVHPTTMSKSNSVDDIEIHGVMLPKGSVFSFDSYSLGMDPNIIDNPDKFIPDRWFPQSITDRKGTRAEILDHAFYRDPFSQGARRCPGSRVAVNETMVMLSQLVLDWKIEPSGNLTSFKDVSYEQNTLLVPEIPEMNLTPR